MKVECGKEFRLESVLSLRRKMTQQQINDEMMKIGKLLQDNEAKKQGPIVTVTFAIENVNGNQLLDMEILVPIDKKLGLTSEYTLKPFFHIVNAIYARHTGDPATLQNTYNEMLAFIQQNNLQQITAGYNVQVNDLLPGMTPDDMIVDVYIGVSPNIL